MCAERVAIPPKGDSYVPGENFRQNEQRAVRTGVADGSC
jgi:hypothetical protein